MKVVVVSDLHFQHDTKWNNITSKMIRRINNILSDDEQVIFVFLGDLINGYEGRTSDDVIELYRKVDEFIEFIRKSIINVKFYFIPGNHDLNNDNSYNRTDLNGFNEFVNRNSEINGSKYTYTEEKSVFSVEENINLILVDSTLSRNYRAKGKIDGKLLKETVSKGPNIQNIIFMHHPPFSVDSYSGYDDKALNNPLDIMYTHAKIVFYGHQHGDHKSTHYCKNNTLYVSVSGLLNVGNEIKNDFILLDVVESELRNCYRYEYNGKEFFKYIVFPEKEEKKIEELSIIVPNLDKKLESMLPRYYYLNDKRKEELNINEILKKHNFIIINGEAGIGKTVESQKLYNEYQNDEEYFPILLDLRTLTSSAVKKYIEYAKKYRINNKDILLIIDGISELTTRVFEEIKLEILTLSQEEKNMKIVISKRANYSIDNFPNEYTQCYLHKYKNSDIIKHAELEGIEDSEEFINAIVSTGVLDLACIPFFLSELINIYITERTLPNIDELFDRILTLRFLETDKNPYNTHKIMPIEYEVRKSFSEFSFVLHSLNLQNIKNIFYSRMFKENIQEIHKQTGLIMTNEHYERYFTHDIFGEIFVANYLYDLDFQSLLDIITFKCSEEKKIKKTWYNVVRRIISIRENDDLINWIIENDIEYLSKSKPEKLNNFQLFKVIKNVLGYCIDKNLPIHTVIEDVSRFVELYECQEMWAYIIQKFEEKQNEYGLSTLLQVIQYTTRLFEKGKAQKIIINILRNGDWPSYITSLALKALININQCSDDYLDEIISILNDVVDIRIIKVIFDIISLSSNPDKYYEYVINKFEIKKRNEIYIEFEHSFINVLYSLKETKSILASVKYMCESDNYALIYNSSIPFENMIKKISDIYIKNKEEQEEIYKSLYDCFILLSINIKAEIIKEFFKKIGKQEEVLYKIIIDDNTLNFYSCIEKIMESSMIETFINFYNNGSVSEDKFEWYMERHSISLEDKDKLILAYKAKTGKDYTTTEKPQWLLNKENGEKEYLESLFNKDVFIDKVEELKQLLGEDIVVSEFWYRYYRCIPDNKQVLDMIGAAIERNANDTMILSQFLENVNWSQFQINEIFEFIKHKKNIELNDEQKSFLKSYFDKLVTEIDFETINFELSSYDAILAMRIVILIEKIGFTCDENKVLDMLMWPWYIFASSTSSGKSETLSFVSTHIKDENQLKERILYNIKYKELNIYAKETHIFYCLENNLSDALNIAIELFNSTDIDATYRKHIAVKYLLEFKGEQYVDALIDSQTEDEILEYLTSYLSNNNDNLINEMIKRNKKADNKLLYVRELLISNNIYGLKQYNEYLAEHNTIPENTSEYSNSDITMQIRKIKDISLLSEIENSLKIAYSIDFNDTDDIWGLKGNLDNAIRNMCSNNFTEMKNMLESVRDNNSQNEELKFKCNYHLEILYDINMTEYEDKSLTFDKVFKYILSRRDSKIQF